MISILGVSLLVVGLLNNNPGNLERNKNNHWIGKVECKKKSRFECFSTPYYGIRATVITLRTYYEKRKLRTVRQIISRWAPRQDGNPTESYINFVANRLGVASDSHLTFHPTQVGSLVMAIIKMENGSNPYPVSLIRRVINGITFEGQPRWNALSVEVQRGIPTLLTERADAFPASASIRGSGEEHIKSTEIPLRSEKITGNGMLRTLKLRSPRLCSILEIIQDSVPLPEPPTGPGNYMLYPTGPARSTLSYSTSLLL